MARSTMLAAAIAVVALVSLSQLAIAQPLGRWQSGFTATFYGGQGDGGSCGYGTAKQSGFGYNSASVSNAIYAAGKLYSPFNLTNIECMAYQLEARCKSAMQPNLQPDGIEVTLSAHMLRRSAEDTLLEAQKNSKRLLGTQMSKRQVESALQSSCKAQQ